MNERSSRLSRRNFLLTVGAGSAAAAAALVAKSGDTPATTSGSGRRATRGYAESAHIRNYYRTAKV